MAFRIPDLSWDHLTLDELKARLDEDVAPPVAFYDQDREVRPSEHSPALPAIPPRAERAGTPATPVAATHPSDAHGPPHAPGRVPSSRPGASTRKAA